MATWGYTAAKSMSRGNTGGGGEGSRRDSSVGYPCRRTILRFRHCPVWAPHTIDGGELQHAQINCLEGALGPRRPDCDRRTRGIYVLVLSIDMTVEEWSSTGRSSSTVNRMRSHLGPKIG